MLEGRLEAQMAEKMTNLVVIIANENDELTVVTIVHAKHDARGRHYRKNIKLRHKNKK